MHLLAELLGFEPGVSWAELYLEMLGGGDGGVVVPLGL